MPDSRITPGSARPIGADRSRSAGGTYVTVRGSTLMPSNSSVTLAAKVGASADSRASRSSTGGGAAAPGWNRIQIQSASFRTSIRYAPSAGKLISTWVFSSSCAAVCAGRSTAAISHGSDARRRRRVRVLRTMDDAFYRAAGGRAENDAPHGVEGVATSRLPRRIRVSCNDGAGFRCSAVPPRAVAPADRHRDASMTIGGSK